MYMYNIILIHRPLEELIIPLQNKYCWAHPNIRTIKLLLVGKN